MKKIIVLFSLLLSFNVFAENNLINFELQNAKLSEVIQLFLKSVLKTEYILHPDVSRDSTLINLSLKDKSYLQSKEIFNLMLTENNIELKEVGGVLYLSKVKSKPLTFQANNSLMNEVTPILKDENFKMPEPEKPKVLVHRFYKPKSRSITYLHKVATFAGAEVMPADDMSPLLFYASHDLTVLERTRENLKLADSDNNSVTIKAAIIEFSKSNEQSLSFSSVLSLLAGKLGVVYSAGQALANSITFKNKTLNLAISALEGDNNFKLISEPTIKVMNGEKGRLLVGAEVPVRGSSVIDKNGNAVQSIDYRSSGLEFEIQPKINGENITLVINQQISNFAVTTTSNIDSPTLFKRQVETTIETKKGNLIMIAGLDEQKDSKSSNGLFFLPKFLHSKNDAATNTQIILLLEIVNEPVLNTPL